MYMSTNPSSQLPAIQLNNCQQEIKTWMTSNLLKLNSSKTELMVVAPTPLLKKVGDLALVIDGCFTSPSPEVQNLGVILESNLLFQSHIKSITKSAFFHLRNISRPSLSDSVTEILSFITSHLDNCNRVLSGLTSKAFDRLQYVQKHINPILKKLHWLPVKQRITYKILLLTYKSLHSLSFKYIIDLHPYSKSRSLPSTGKDLLSIPQTGLRIYGDRAFCATYHFTSVLPPF